MSAVDVIENLVKLGTVIGDAVTSNTKGGKFNLSSFLKSDAGKNIADSVDGLIATLKPDQLKAAIDSVAKKQQALLGGKQLTDLSTDKLVQYSALSDTKLALSTAAVKQAAKNDFLDWLQNGGLSDLIKIAQVVIPILL